MFIHFWSYFRDRMGVPKLDFPFVPGETLGQVLDRFYLAYPQMEPLRASTLVAVNVDYETASYQLKSTDEISLFPPVQGG